MSPFSVGSRTVYFANLRARNVFHRQLEKVSLDCSEHRDQHILFRKSFHIDRNFSFAKIYISADDYCNDENCVI